MLYQTSYFRENVQTPLTTYGSDCVHLLCFGFRPWLFQLPYQFVVCTAPGPFSDYLQPSSAISPTFLKQNSVQRVHGYLLQVPSSSYSLSGYRSTASSVQVWNPNGLIWVSKFLAPQNQGYFYSFFPIQFCPFSPHLHQTQVMHRIFLKIKHNLCLLHQTHRLHLFHCVLFLHPMLLPLCQNHHHSHIIHLCHVCITA